MSPHRDITPGSPNVIRDLEVPDPELHQLKAELVSALNRLIQEGGWTLETAAERLGLEREELRDLTRGLFHEVSLDELAQAVVRLGGVITLVVGPGEPSEAKARGTTSSEAGRQPEAVAEQVRRMPNLDESPALSDRLAGVPPEAGGEALDPSRGETDLTWPSPTGEDLFAQVTGLNQQETAAVLCQEAAVPSRVSGHQVVVNLADLLRMPWRDVLPVLGVTDEPVVPSRELLLQTSRVLELFAVILAVLDEDDAAHWFTKPNRHLDGQRPLELCQTPDGQHRLRDYLNALLSGNFA